MIEMKTIARKQWEQIAESKDHTFNPWLGCTKVSAGCANCYSETLMDKRFDRVKWGVHGKRVRTSAANWRKPRHGNISRTRSAKIAPGACLTGACGMNFRGVKNEL